MSHVDGWVSITQRRGFDQPVVPTHELLFYLLATFKIISGRVPTCLNFMVLPHWETRLLTPQPSYPTRSYYPNTVLTGSCPILLILSTRLGSDKYLFYKSLVWLDQDSKSCSSAQEACALTESVTTSSTHEPTKRYMLQTHKDIYIYIYISLRASLWEGILVRLQHIYRYIIFMYIRPNHSLKLWLSGISWLHSILVLCRLSIAATWRTDQNLKGGKLIVNSLRFRYNGSVAWMSLRRLLHTTQLQVEYLRELNFCWFL